MEEQEGIAWIEPENWTWFFFTVDKQPLFVQLLTSLPQEEVGKFEVWDLFRTIEKTYEEENRGTLTVKEQLFCLNTGFREEHIELEQMSKEQSIAWFQRPYYHLIVQFLNVVPSEWSDELKDYLTSIGK